MTQRKEKRIYVIVDVETLKQLKKYMKAKHPAVTGVAPFVGYHVIPEFLKQVENEAPSGTQV